MSTDTFVESILDGRFSRYKERLGSGAYKTVFKGYDHENGIEVAWNQIKFERLKQPERDRLNEEIRILQVIKHPNIINLYHFYVDEDKKRLVILTELMTSGTLRQFVLKSHHRTKLKVIKRWCIQILKGLSYLHSQNIIHRDLKCDNIFINGSQGEVKIGDLGLSTAMTNRTHAESVIGTPEFMAPEFYDEYYTEKVDTYAFGMCLLEMVTQEYPYSECTNAAQIYKKVTGGRPPGALLRIENVEVRQFIELCIGSFEDRPSPSELLNHKFFSTEGPNDSEPVRMRSVESDIKGLDTRPQGVVDGPAAAPSSSNSTSNGQPVVTLFPTQGSSKSTEGTGAEGEDRVVSEVRTGTTVSSPEGVGVEGEDVAQHKASTEVPPAPAPAQVVPPVSTEPVPVPKEPKEPSAQKPELVVKRESSHDFRIDGDGNPPNKQPSEHIPIQLKLDIGAVTKEVTFEYNVETDTAEDVAREMVNDLGLDCNVSWLTKQLQDRVDAMVSSSAFNQASSQGGSTPPRRPRPSIDDETSRGNIHDSPRINAVTVTDPHKSGHSTDVKPHQTGEGTWVLPAINMPTVDLSEPVIDTSGHGSQASEPAPAPQPPTASPVVTDSEVGSNDMPGSRRGSENKSGGSSPESDERPADTSADAGSELSSAAEPTTKVHPEGEAQLLEELAELDGKIMELNKQVMELNKARSQKMEQLQELRENLAQAAAAKSSDHEAVAEREAATEREAEEQNTANSEQSPPVSDTMPSTASPDTTTEDAGVVGKGVDEAQAGREATLTQPPQGPSAVAEDAGASNQAEGYKKDAGANKVANVDDAMANVLQKMSAKKTITNDMSNPKAHRNVTHEEPISRTSIP